MSQNFSQFFKSPAEEFGDIMVQKDQNDRFMTYNKVYGKSLTILL